MILKFKDFIKEEYIFNKEINDKDERVHPKEMPLLFKDDKLEVRVVKTFNAAKYQGKNTNWCSNHDYGFYSHYLTSNMYRFNFSDGFKLRLTWDYINVDASELGKFSGGTHWGQGGIVDGKYKDYLYIRPRDENDPFKFDYNKKDDRLEMISRINSIPEKAKQAVIKYQSENSNTKTGLFNSLYKEIEKIKINKVSKGQSDWEDLVLDIQSSYLGKRYDLTLNFYSQGRFSFSLGNLNKEFNSKYHMIGKVMSQYLYDKTMECIKKENNKELLDDIKYARTGVSED